MKNTGITYTSAERSPVILPEMAELLPPLSAEQSAALEEDLLRNGCYSPIIVNEDMVIVDGHNRQALCEKHGLPYLYPSTPKVSRQGKRKAETSYKAQTFCKTRCILPCRPYARGSRWLWIEV